MKHAGTELADEISTFPVAKGQCAFWWLGQHGFAIKLGGVVCYLDPFLSPLKGRLVPPLLTPRAVTNAALVLGSHDHADHIDRAAWPGIAQASPTARFVVPALLRARLVRELGLPGARVLGVDAGKTLRAAGVTIKAVPAAHERLDIDPATGRYPYLGFVLEYGGFRLYHAGDTCLYEGIQSTLRSVGPIDLAFLPINGRDARRLSRGCIGNMTYQEAADLAGAISPGLTVPTHFEMFAANRGQPRAFAAYMKVKYPHLRTRIPRHGQAVVVSR